MRKIEVLPPVRRPLGVRGRLVVAVVMGALARAGALIFLAQSLEGLLLLVAVAGLAAAVVAPSWRGVLAVAAGAVVIAVAAAAFGWRSPALPSVVVELPLDLVAAGFGALVGAFVRGRAARMLDEPRAHEEWPGGRGIR